MICRFDASALDQITIGSQLTFHTAKPSGSEKRLFLGASSTETLTTTFQVAKTVPDGTHPEPISNDELSSILRWLNRKDGYYKFRLIQKDFENIYTLANFNVTKIEMAGQVYGLELTMHTLFPYLLEDSACMEFETFSHNETFSIYDHSDQTGHIYPNVKITCKAAGDLHISNSMEEHRITILNKCMEGEEITLNGDAFLISSSAGRAIQEDFNFVFPRIANTFEQRNNDITVSLPCRLQLEWSPIRKVGF